MISFTLKLDEYESIKKVLKALDVFSIAESLGGVESLIGHPASMSHAALTKEERLANGISDALLRMSVGIEDVQDLKADLENALSLV